MRFRINGVELPAATNFKVREVCEAEKTLGLSLDETGMAGKAAVALFIAMRRADPDRHPVEIADEVMDADMSTMQQVDDESPPVEAAPVVDGNGAGREPLLTSGASRSDSTA